MNMQAPDKTAGNNPSVSIICCYTSRDKLSYLSSSLDEQRFPAERVFVDNSTGRFPSAALALNHGARLSSGKLLLFCHQDIRFKDEDALGDLVGSCSILGNGDVGGVAGATSVSGRLWFPTNITHSDRELPYSPRSHFDTRSTEVDTIDECVIILPRATWEQHHFDEDICDSWHFYGAEQSLHAKLSAHHVYVFDARINHLSSAGTFDDAFFRALRRLSAAYGDKVSTVVTTTGPWSLRHPWTSITRRKLSQALARRQGGIHAPL